MACAARTTWMGRRILWVGEKNGRGEGRWIPRSPTARDRGHPSSVVGFTSLGTGATRRSRVPIDKEEGCVKHKIRQTYPDGA